MDVVDAIKITGAVLRLIGALLTWVFLSLSRKLSNENGVRFNDVLAEKALWSYHLFFGILSVTLCTFMLLMMLNT